MAKEAAPRAQGPAERERLNTSSNPAKRGQEEHVMPSCLAANHAASNVLLQAMLQAMPCCRPRFQPTLEGVWADTPHHAPPLLLEKENQILEPESIFQDQPPNLLLSRAFLANKAGRACAARQLALPWQQTARPRSRAFPETLPLPGIASPQRRVTMATPGGSGRLVDSQRATPFGPASSGSSPRQRVTMATRRPSPRRVV